MLLNQLNDWEFMMPGFRLSMCIIVTALVFVAVAVARTAPIAEVITGAGATSTSQIYTKWASNYQMQTGAMMNYTPTVGGVEKILSKAVDFVATDVPMTQDELEKNGLVQFPTLIGGIVPVINLDGVAEGQLKLSGDVLADIFLGRITKWNDARIAADNDGVKLPNQAINVVHRTDVGSGSTNMFTSYLSQVSQEWGSSMGAGSIIHWKTGVGTRGSWEMASYVKDVSSSIGYLEYSYARQEKINYAQLKSFGGSFVKPSVASFKAASIGIESSQYFREPMINKPAKDAWPITSATFILIRKSTDSRKVIKFFGWAFDNGGEIAVDMGYMLLPEKVQESLIEVRWNQTLAERFKMLLN